MNKFLLYSFFLIFLSACGSSEKDILENSNVKNIFKKTEPITQEFNPTLKIKLNKLTRGTPFFGNNTNNSGNSDFENEFKKIKYFKFKKIDDFDFSQPELIFTKDNSIIFFDGDGSIFKINSQLKEVWKVNYYSKNEKKLSPILYFEQDGKNIIVADTLSKYYSIDLETGNLLWSSENSSPFNSNIKNFKDTFFVADFDNVIRCFSKLDGKEIWNFETENSFIKSQKKLSLILKGETVFFINNLGDITALNANDGSLVWQTPTQSNVIYQNAFSIENSDLVFANNSIYFSNNKNEIFSIDSRSGIVNWKQSVNSSLRPTVVENLIFSISKEGFLFVINDKSGKIVRITNLFSILKNKKNKIRPTGFIMGKNKIYLSLSNGNLMKIDALSGIEKELFKLHGSKISRPYVLNGDVYLIKNNSIIKSVKNDT